MKQRTTVANSFIRLSPSVECYVDYHMDMPQNKATIAAWRISEFIKWAFNDKETCARFKAHSPAPEIVNVDTIDDLKQYCEG